MRRPHAAEIADLTERPDLVVVLRAHSSQPELLEIAQTAVCRAFSLGPGEHREEIAARIAMMAIITRSRSA